MKLQKPHPANSLQLSLCVRYEPLEARILFTAVSPISVENGIVHVAASEYNQIMISPYFADEVGSSKSSFLIDAMKPGSGFGAQFLMSEIGGITIDSEGTKNTIVILREGDGNPITFKFDLVGERTNYVFFHATDKEYVAAMTGGADVEKQLDGNADDLLLASVTPVATRDTQSTAESATAAPAPPVPPFSTLSLAATDAKKDGDAIWA